MDFRFTISIEKLGARKDAEDNAEALLNAFEHTHPEAAAAVGANLEAELLEVTFCASGKSLSDAAEKAGRIFVDAAIQSDLEPSPLVSFEVEADLTERPSPALPRIKRRRGAEAWTMPKLVRMA